MEDIKEIEEDLNIFIAWGFLVIRTDFLSLPEEVFSLTIISITIIILQMQYIYRVQTTAFALKTFPEPLISTI